MKKKTNVGNVSVKYSPKTAEAISPLTLSERLAALEEPGVFEEILPEGNGGGFVFVGGVVETQYAATKPKTDGDAPDGPKNERGGRNN